MFSLKKRSPKQILQAFVNMTTIHKDEAISVPWQTSEAQVGGFAYCEGPAQKGALPVVHGFVYMQGRGGKSMSVNSLNPSWQRAFMTIEGHLDNARAIIRQNKRAFHFRDPFGESCRALNASWIPMVNQVLQDTGFSVDCVPVMGRIHYICIRISITLAAKVTPVVQRALSKNGVAAGVGKPVSTPTSSRTSSRDLYDPKLAKKMASMNSDTLTTGMNNSPKEKEAHPRTTLFAPSMDPLAPHPAVSERILRQEASYRELVKQLGENAKAPGTREKEITELEQELRRERSRTAVQAIQIEQLGEQLNEQTARNTIQEDNMEDLIVQLREERLLNEEQAETIGRLERRLKETSAELDFLRCHLALDSNQSTHTNDKIVEVDKGDSTKDKKHKKSKKKKIDPDKSKSKRNNKKKEKKVQGKIDATQVEERKVLQDDDGTVLRQSVDRLGESQVPPTDEQIAQKDDSENSGSTEELSTSSNPFVYPPPYLVQS